MANPVVRVVLALKDELTGELRKATRGVQSFSSSLTTLGKGIAGILSIRAIGRFFVDTVQESLAASQSVGQLDGALRRVGSSYGAVRPEVEGLLTAQQNLTGQSDDLLRNALRQLILLTGNYQKSLANLPLVVDVAVGSQRSLETSAILVGKTLSGNTRGLREIGIEVKSAGEGMQVLRDRFTGQAEAAERARGGIGAVAEAYGDLKEAIGEALVPTEELGAATGELTRLLREAEQVARTVQVGGLTGFFVLLLKLLAAVGAALTELVIDGLLSIGKILGDLTDRTGRLIQGVGTLGAKLSGAIFGKTAPTTRLLQGLGARGERLAELGRIQREQSDLAIRTNQGTFAQFIDRLFAPSTPKPSGGDPEDDRETEDDGRETASRRLALAREIAAARIQLEQNITASAAKAILQRREDLGREIQAVTDVRAAYGELDRLQTLLAGREAFGKSVERLTEQTREINAATNDRLRLNVQIQGGRNPLTADVPRLPNGERADIGFGTADALRLFREKGEKEAQAVGRAFEAMAQRVGDAIASTLFQSRNLFEGLASLARQITQEILAAFLRTQIQKFALKVFKIPIPSFAHGGVLTGPGGPREDAAFFRGSPGEGVLTAATVRALGGAPAIAALNGGRVPGALTATSRPVVTQQTINIQTGLPVQVHAQLRTLALQVGAEGAALALGRAQARR